MISSTIRKVGPFIGTGLVSTFPFSFKVFAATDLRAVQADSAGNETGLVLNNSFTASLNADQDNNPGGSITLTAALPTGSTLIITTAIAETQGVQLTDLGGFYPTVLNFLHDKFVILLQQQQEQIDRCIKFPTTDTSGSQLPNAESRVSSILGFGADGSPSIVTAAPITTGTLFAGILTGTKNGTNKTFAFTNGGSPTGKTPVQAMVWCNYPMINNVGYTFGPSPGQVTFTNAPLSTDDLYAQGVY